MKQKKFNKPIKRILTLVFIALFLAGFSVTSLISINLGATTPAAEELETDISVDANEIGSATLYTYGGSGYYDDGFDLAIDASDILYLGGLTKETGNYDIVVYKVNPSGSEIWRKVWGGTSTETESGIAVDTSGNVYVTGSTFDGVGIMDVFILKYNSGGTLQWEPLWGVTSTTSMGHEIIVDGNSVYVVGSTTWTRANGMGGLDMLVLKYDMAGNQLWNTTWGGLGSDSAYGVTIDNNILYVVGKTESWGAGDQDLALVKFSATNGALISNTTWGGALGDGGNDLVLVGSNLYIAAWTESYGAGQTDAAFVCISTSLVYQWHKTWGTALNDEVAGCIDTYALNFVLGGNIELRDALVLQYNLTGGLVDSVTWDSGGNGNDTLGDLVIDSAGNAWAIGTSDGVVAAYSDIILLKFEVTPEIPAFGVELVFLGILTAVSIGVLLRKKMRNVYFK